MYGAEENAAWHGGGEAPIYFTDADFSTANILIELPIRQHSTTVNAAEKISAGLGGGEAPINFYWRGF